MEFLGIQFAPLKIPINRRLQTAAVLYWASSFLFFGFGGLIVFLILLKYFTWIALIYITWYWIDYKTCRRGGRRYTWLRRCIAWCYLRDYFPVQLIKTAELDPKKNYVCGYHPHGVLCLGTFANFGTEATGFSEKFQNITPYVLTLNVQFMFPFYREFIMSFGACSVNLDSIEWILNCEGTGNMAVIVIGGAKEALDAHPGRVKLTLKNRKGFVRVAVQNGASLLPIFAFGENELYTQLPNEEGTFLRKFQMFFTKFVGFSPPAFHGRGIFQYTFGYVPYRHPVNVVVGKPIDVEKIEHPTKEIINHYHNLYMESLTELFNEHKKNYEFYKNIKLEIN